jgi:methylenetetrahydrofolate reductase (NADPH)
VIGANEVLVDFLRRPRLEVMPLDGVEQAVIEHVPSQLTITVTSSPTRGIDATLSLCERLAARGYRVVPHLAARLVVDRGHLHELLARLGERGLREVFVVAGDIGQPAGEFEGAAALLAAMAEAGHALEEIGITGYPESHPLISDELTIQAMFDKAPMATCIISQLCFDADTIATWVARVRARGTHLPIWIGVPGLVHRSKLLRISIKIGLGESARFALAHRAWAMRLIARQFKRDRLLRELAPSFADPGANVAGVHLFTFNEVARTERWRQAMLARLGATA